MINPEHLREYVIRPTLQRLGSRYVSEDAVELLLMIAAHESHLGYYLKQIDGPAIGIYQMEPDTFYDVLVNYVRYNKILETKLGSDWYQFPSPAFMTFDLSFATAMARIHLYRVAEPLPHRENLQAMAEYAKKHWNTEEGKATVDDYIRAYVDLVQGGWEEVMENGPQFNTEYEQ